MIITTTLDEIFEKFKESGAKILFSAEKYCWPDKSLANDYPEVEGKASRFLNSGAFIGYAPQVFALLEDPIEDTADDQLYFTKIFLDETKRAKLGLKLDVQSRLFQNLHGAKNDVKLKVDLESNQGVLQNVDFMTTPSIIHGNGLSKVDLNAYGNYLARTFNGVCLLCQENLLDLEVSDFENAYKHAYNKYTICFLGDKPTCDFPSPDGHATRTLFRPVSGGHRESELS